MDLIKLGLIFLFLGIILIFLGSIFSAKSSDTKVAMGGFIGPIPWGFMSDKKMLPILIGLLILGLIIMILMKKYV